MPIEDFNCLTSLKRNHYLHIGEVIYRTSLLDVQLVEILGLILGLNKKQRRLAYTNSDFKGKLAVLKTTASKWVLDGKLRELINGLIGNAFELEDRRNLYAHTVFGYLSGKPDEIKILHVRTGEQRHLPQTEQYDEARAAEERGAYFDANRVAQHIIGILSAEKDNPKFLKLSLRMPDPQFPKTP